jgi:hypothetical protein
MELRPLDFGEILERSLELYARSFARFVALVAVTVLPVAIVQYLVLLRQQPALAATFDILRHPERLQSERVPTLFNSPDMLAIVIASALFAYYMLGFTLAAVAAAVARYDAGQPIGVRACYAIVLPRWGSIVAVVGSGVLALVIAYMGALVVALIPLSIGAAFGAGILSLVVTLSIGGVLIVIGVAFLLILVTTACALCGVVVEASTAAWSVRMTIERIFNRREFGRALLCAFTVTAIGLAASTLIDAVAFIGFAHSEAAYVGVDAAGRLIVVPFLALVFAIYYFDVRTRDDITMLATGPDEPVYAPTAYLSGEERALIKRFLERRALLSASRRLQIAAQLAAPVRKRLPPELRVLDDESLLERL